MKALYNNGEVRTLAPEEESHVIRHTAAHIMAQAILRLHPQAKFAYGPATERGFYYDVDLGEEKLSDEDLAAIEAEMAKITKENLPIKTYELPRDEAIRLMESRGEVYKVEHIGDLDADARITFYQQGDYIDMCVGPHLTYTKALKAFKITGQSGAYWKNNSENKMLTRINGVAFHNAEELQAWEKEQEEARARDHRRIGKEMKLFMTDDLVGKGLPMFLPKGYVLWQILENYIKDKERRLGYLHVMTPCVGTVDLYRTSGHWEHYKENMFPPMVMEGEEYVLRPMNCPHHMRIYANQPRSYRNLPLRIAEIAHDFRYESSGTLKGIERGRHFCQNDAHLFVTPEQIKSEIACVCDLIFDADKDFNITDYRCVLSLRDPADKKKYHDDDEMWNTAEKKFNLTYVDQDGTEKTPVVIHRAILGSLDRFMAYLIEETKGRFPVWLAPVQVKVLPVSEKYMEYSTGVLNRLLDEGIRAELDERNEKIGYKIREAQQVEHVPYMLILGQKESEAGNVTFRNRDTGLFRYQLLHLKRNVSVFILDIAQDHHEWGLFVAVPVTDLFDPLHGCFL